MLPSLSSFLNIPCNPAAKEESFAMDDANAYVLDMETVEIAKSRFDQHNLVEERTNGASKEKYTGPDFLTNGGALQLTNGG